MIRLLFFLCFLALMPIAGAQEPTTLDREQLIGYFQNQQYEEASQLLKGVITEQTKDARLVQQLAYCYLMTGQLAAAETTYLQAYQLQPNSLPILFQLAAIQQKRGHMARARLYLELAIPIDSANFNVYRRLADTYTDEIDSTRIVYLQKAYELKPSDSDVAYDLAMAYKKIKRQDAAYEILKKAMDLDKENLFLMNAMIPLALHQKHYEEVLQLGDYLSDMMELDGGILKDLGMANYRLNRYQKAIAYFKKLEDKEMESENALFYTSLCYLALKDFPNAQKYAQMTINAGISPNTAGNYTLLGMSYEQNQQFSLAASTYKKGLNYKKERDIYYRLGLLYDLKLKQKVNALTYYRLYLQSKPDPEAEAEQIAYVKEKVRNLNAPKASSH